LLCRPRVVSDARTLRSVRSANEAAGRHSGGFTIVALPAGFLPDLVNKLLMFRRLLAPAQTGSRSHVARQHANPTSPILTRTRAIRPRAFSTERL
jgi:hypothetical protein